MADLAQHPIFQATDPMRSTLVRISDPFPPSLNPLANDNVVIRAAMVPGEIPHVKFYMGRELVLNGVSSGAITAETTVVESSSGNTAHAIAVFCNALGIKARFIMSSDTPADKVNLIRVMGSNIEVILHSDPKESPVERARREGQQDGFFNPDQYKNALNAEAHKKYLGTQLFRRAAEIGIEPSLIGVASGTMGTCMGLQQAALADEWATRIIPVLCAPKEEVPGARTLQKVLRDIRNPWQELFTMEDLEFGTRHESFLLSYLSWQCLPQQLGPSFGLAGLGTIQRLWKAKQAGTLDQFRNSDGIVEALVLGPDSYLPYVNVILGELRTEELVGLQQEREDLSEILMLA